MNWQSMQVSSGFINLNLNRYSFWLVLVVFILVILGTFQNLFLDDLSSVPNAEGWSMEYNWSTYVAKGIPLYPEEDSFIEGQSLAYMPLYFIVTGNLMKVFGTSAVVGKLISAVCVLGIALLIYKIGFRLTNRRWLSAIPSLLFLFYPLIGNYTASQMKIELLGIFLLTVGLYLVLNKRYLWSVPFVVLAFFTKQYFMGVPIAVGIYLLFRDRQCLVKYVGLYLVLIAVGFGIGQLVTNGTFFTHTVLYLFSAPDFTTLTVERTLVGTLICVGYLTPVLAIAGYGMWKTKTFGLLGIYLVVSLLILVVTISKVGSGINYTFDSLVVGCCLASLVLKGRHEEILERNTIL